MSGRTASALGKLLLVRCSRVAIATNTQALTELGDLCSAATVMPTARGASAQQCSAHTTEFIAICEALPPPPTCEPVQRRICYGIALETAEIDSSCSGRARSHEQASTSSALQHQPQLRHTRQHLGAAHLLLANFHRPRALSTSRHLASSMHAESAPSDFIASTIIAQQAASDLRAQLARCVTVDQLDEVVTTHLHLMDARCIMQALDLLVRNIASMRGAPRMEALCDKLGAAYREQLPALPTPKALSIMHSFAITRINPGGDEAGFQAICNHFRDLVLPTLQQQASYTELANLLWAVNALSQHGELVFDQQMLAQSEPTLRLFLKSMPLSLLSKVTEVYAGAGDAYHSFLEQVPLVLNERLQARYGAFDAPAVSNIFKSLAHSRAPVPGQLLRLVAEHVVQRSSGLQLHHVVSLAKSFALLRFGDMDDPDKSYDVERFWNAVSGYAERNRQRLTPQMLQDLAYAWALRKHQDETLYNLLASRACALLHTFKPVNLSILLWGFARQGRSQDTKLYAAAAKHIIAKLHTFTIQNIANSIWALACLDQRDEPLLLAVAAHLKQLLQDPDGRAGLTVDAQSGRERYYVPDKCVRVERYVDAGGAVWQDIEYKSGNKVTRALGTGIAQRQFIMQNLTDLMWAFAKLEHVDEELFGVLAERCLDNIDSLTITSAVDCCWALTRMKLSHPGLLLALEQHLLKTSLLYHLGIDYLADVLYAMAVLQHKPIAEFVKACLDLAQGKWDRLRPSQDSTIVRIIYSFQELGALDLFPSHPFIARIDDYISLHQEAAQGGSQAGPAAA